jgi:membrane protease YdiL (CAAX protease family)
MISSKPWGIYGAARLCLAIVATFCVGMMLAGIVEKLRLGWPQSQIEFFQMMISFLFLQMSALVWITLFARQYAIGWKEAFGFNLSPPLTAAACGALAGTLFVPIGWGLEYVSKAIMDLLHLTPELQTAVQALQNPNLSLAEKLFLGAAAILLAPIAEEAIFRGILYPAIKQAGYPRLALWGTSGVFAIIHANELTFLPLLVFALALVYLYEAFGNLLAPIFAHSLFNAANFFILIFQDKIEHVFHIT